MTDKSHGIRKWVEEVTALTTPDRIVYCDGSAIEKQSLIKDSLDTGELI